MKLPQPPLKFGRQLKNCIAMKGFAIMLSKKRLLTVLMVLCFVLANIFPCYAAIDGNKQPIDQKTRAKLAQEYGLSEPNPYKNNSTKIIILVQLDNKQLIGFDANEASRFFLLGAWALQQIYTL